LKFFFVVSSHKLAHTPCILIVAHGALKNGYGKVETIIAFVIMHYVCEYVFAIMMVFCAMTKLWALWQLVYGTNVKDERDTNLEPLFEQENLRQLKGGLTFSTYMQGNKELKNSRTHFNFRFGLIEQLWAMKGLNQLDWNKKIRWNKSLIKMYYCWSYFLRLSLVAYG